MKTFPVCYYSNRVEVLYEQMRDLLFGSTTSAFTKRIVIVPSSAMKRFLMMRLANDPLIGMAMGLQFPYLQSAVSELSKTYFDVSLSSFTSTLELSLRIEAEIRRAYTSYCSLKFEEQKAFDELFAYLKVDPKAISCTWSPKSMNRLLSMSKTLAALFPEYGKTAFSMLQAWENDPFIEGYQSLLWTRIYGNNYPYRSLERISQITPQISDVQVHLFCLSFIPRVYYKFFLELAKYTPLFVHLLSPTAHYWTDVRSDKENDYIQAVLKKQGVREEERNELLEYLRDTNPILANFGKVGRKFVSFVEEEDPVSFQKYILPRNLEGQYSAWMTDDIVVSHENCKSSLLQMVQADLLFMRNPRTTKKMRVDADEKSIQVHAAHSKLREVQILYDNILKIIAEEHFVPSDFMVMAPNINEYAPHIKAIFSRKESVLDYQLLDLKISTHNKFAEGYERLLNLVDGRWTVSSLMHLLEHPQFHKKHAITEEEVSSIKKWTSKSHICWGRDLAHRKEIMKKLYEKDLEASSSSTWESSFEELLDGISLQNDDTTKSLNFTQGALLSKWLEIIRSLKEDLKPLEDKKELTLTQWSSYLKCLLEAYFVVDEHDAEEKAQWEYVMKQFSLFSQASYFVEGQSPHVYFSYTSLAPHIKKILQEESYSLHENKLSSIRFCSLLTMRAIPAAVVCLMGMNESAFPRRAEVHALDLRKKYKGIDFSPLGTDYDRYLFLEALLSARSYLIMSYSGLLQDNETSCSPLVLELLNYVHHAFDTEITVQTHPIDAFHASYFSTNGYSSWQEFLLAEVHYSKEKLSNFRVFPEFFAKVQEPSLDISENDLVVNIRDIETAFIKPLKVYLNHSFELFLQHRDLINRDEEVLSLSPLVLYQLKKASLKFSLDKILSTVEKRGELPHGLFKSLAIDQIVFEIEKFHANLRKLDIDKSDIRRIILKDECKRSIQFSEDTHLLPPVIVPFEGKNIRIVGRLEEVAGPGLLSFRKDQFKDVCKEFPRYILLHLLQEVVSEKNLLLCESAKRKAPIFTDPLSLMQKLLSCYFHSKHNPSLLFVDWAEDIVNREPRKLEIKMKASFSEWKKGNIDPYVAFALNKEDLSCASLFLSDVQGAAVDLFSLVKEGWY